MQRLVKNLVEKFNDSKEVVRNEIERLIVKISIFMKIRELILLLLSKLEDTSFEDIAKKSTIQLIIILLLNHEKELKNTGNS